MKHSHRLAPALCLFALHPVFGGHDETFTGTTRIEGPLEIATDGAPSQPGLWYADDLDLGLFLVAPEAMPSTSVLEQSIQLNGGERILAWMPEINAFYVGEIWNWHEFGKGSFGVNADWLAGENAIAIGSQSYVDARDGIALGMSAYAFGEGVVAIGPGAGGFMRDSVAVGQYAFAGAEASIAVGNGAASDGTNAIAIGKGAYALYSASGSVALGEHSTAYGNGSVALGSSNAYYNELAFGFADRANIGGSNDVYENFWEWNPLSPVLTIGMGQSANEGRIALLTRKNGQTTLTNDHWAADVEVGGDPLNTPTTPDASDGEALLVQGHARFEGKVILAQPQGDISMGVFGRQ